MLKNYFKVTVRNLVRHKLYSFLNIAGLAAGITCCLLIMMYIQDELSYDRFHENSGSICRLNITFSTAERTIRAATAPHVAGPMFTADYPEIDNFVRFQWGSRRVIRYEDRSFYEEKFMFADSSLFNVFSFNLLRGNPETVLASPYSVVITEEMAEKYFGDEDPMGKNLVVHFDDEYTITGVVKNIPMNSHYRPDFFASFSTLELEPTGNFAEDFLGNIDYLTYFLLQENADYREMNNKLLAFVEQRLQQLLDSFGATMEISLQPLTDIYLHSDRDYDIGSSSDITYVYLFSGIGFFILLIACLNFMNLATARSAGRAKEVGLRKVVGAQRLQLIGQFIGESYIMTAAAVLTALLLVSLSLPLFNALSGKELTGNYLANPVLLSGIAGLFIVVGMIGGSYPAFFLSAFRPADTLKGSLGRGSKSSYLRIVLVSLQFTVSIILIIGTVIIYDQLRFMQNKNLGWDKEQVIIFRMRNEDIQAKYEAIKGELLSNPNVLKVSASGNSPMDIIGANAHHGVGRPDNEIQVFYIQLGDVDYLDTYGIELVEGRNFSEEFSTDFEEAALVNETLLKDLGWEDDPIGKELEIFTGVETRVKKRVIGVVKDFHFESLHREIQPLVIYNSVPFSNYFYISARIRPENVSETVEFVRSKWEEFDSQYPFEYSFVDENYGELYRAEERLGSLVGYFTLLAIIIGCLGLFGLASFSAEQRTKEIGIRKVLGASVPGVVFLMIKEFIKWVLAANLIAWPAGYLLMNYWLQNFAFRIDIGLYTFILAALLSLFTAVITVSYQAVRASVSDPVKALRYE
ncbi:ABC transporter permease [candidate division KSB1 bacterium]